jgi:chemotaxis methyl-accepting protein methylase
VFFERGRAARRRGVQPESAHIRAGVADELCNDERSRTERDFLQWAFQEAGLNANCYRPETLHRRVPACLRELRVTSLVDARRVIEQDRGKLAKAVGSLVIGVTSFFRDEHVFNDLRAHVLPTFPRPPLRSRVWSVGCSDGEELYSVAILLAEADLLESAELLGTDCRGHAIAHAREAVYQPAALRSVSPRQWDRYFLPEATHVRVAPQLRSAARWRVADATQICEPGAWDMILCRNMAMYLRSNVAAALWRRLEHALRPGGFLVLGKAERPTGTRQLAAVAPCIYRKN